MAPGSEFCGFETCNQLLPSIFEPWREYQRRADLVGWLVQRP
jgi:hypothetical protein